MPKFEITLCQTRTFYRTMMIEAASEDYARQTAYAAAGGYKPMRGFVLDSGEWCDPEYGAPTVLDSEEKS
jgi:hypothetical protein